MASKKNTLMIAGAVGVGALIYVMMKKKKVTTTTVAATNSSAGSSSLEQQAINALSSSGALDSAASAVSDLFAGMGRLPLRNRRRY